MGAAVNQLQGEKRLLFVIRPGAPDHGAAVDHSPLELLFIIGAAVYQLLLIRSRAKNGCCLSFALVLLIIGAAGAPLLTCAHGYVTDIQEGLAMLQVSPSILDRGSCLFVSSSSIDLGLGLGSLHTGYTYHLHSWKSAKPAPRA